MSNPGLKENRNTSSVVHKLQNLYRDYCSPGLRNRRTPDVSVVTDSDTSDNIGKSETEWKALKERTEEMRVTARNCMGLTSHAVGNDIINQLDNISQFMAKIDKPDEQDLKYVNAQVGTVKYLVCEVVDSFILQQKSQNSGFFRSVFQVVKIITGCFILSVFVAILSELTSGDTGPSFG